MPDLPAGPIRDLTAALHELYRNAGYPSLRTISEWILRDNGLPVTASHEVVRMILKGKPTTWERTRSFAHVLMAESSPPDGTEATMSRIKELWLAVGDARVAGETAQAGAQLDLTVGWLHGEGPRAAVKIILRSRVLVPLTSDSGFVLAETSSRGRWLCAFTNPERLAAHQAVTDPAWRATWSPMAGRELFERLRAVAPEAHILVDGWTAGSALPISATIIAESVS